MSELDFNAAQLKTDLHGTVLADWSEQLASAVANQGHALKHGHLPGWEQAVATLPAIDNTRLAINEGVVCLNGALDDNEFEQHRDQLMQSLQALIPWRKGPFAFGPISIDTEWRSDWKWDRLVGELQPLQDRVVLDVGCGNGYHLWRMREAGAQQVLGIDPSLLYLKQFDAVQRYACDKAVQLLPLTMEAMPPAMHCFDTVFSMGVLYHRRDPIAHLRELQQALRADGELVLETLIVDDNTETSLELTTRYANMRNIYELPSPRRLCRWIEEAGFGNTRVVSVDHTSVQEQRSTAWMPSHSLQQALDPANEHLTVEGHPRPVRAVVLATSELP